MKLSIAVLLQLFVVTACTTLAPTPSVREFHLTRPATDAPSDSDEFDIATFFVMPSGNLGARAFVVTRGEQDASKAKGWLVLDRGKMTLCYSLPEYPMPPISDPNVAYAPVAYITLLEYEFRGLSVAPKHVVVSDRCNGR